MVNRRMVGHGNLAERAVLSVMPETEMFAYTTRVSAEVGWVSRWSVDESDDMMALARETGRDMSFACLRVACLQVAFLHVACLAAGTRPEIQLCVYADVVLSFFEGPARQTPGVHVNFFFLPVNFVCVLGACVSCLCDELTARRIASSRRVLPSVLSRHTMCSFCFFSESTAMWEIISVFSGGKNIYRDPVQPRNTGA